MVYVVSGIGVLMAGQAWLLWRVWRAFDELGQRSSRIDAAVQLLAETTETGFSSYASVVTQALQPATEAKPIRAPRRRSTRRVAVAPAKRQGAVAGSGKELHG